MYNNVKSRLLNVRPRNVREAMLMLNAERREGGAEVEVETKCVAVVRLQEDWRWARMRRRDGLVSRGGVQT